MAVERTMAMVVVEAPEDVEVVNSRTGADFPGSRRKQRVISKKKKKKFFGGQAQEGELAK